MRKLISLIVVLVVIGIGLAIADVWVRRDVQRLAAHRIETRVPGSHATVAISSFPFLARLAAAGTVRELHVHVTGAAEGGLELSSVDVDLRNLKVKRSSLWRGQVTLDGISSGSVTADISQASVDRAVGLPVQFGSGTVGLAGVNEPAQVTVNGQQVHVAVGSLTSFTVTVARLSLVPCVGTAVIRPGVLQVSCTLSQLPPALAQSARI